MSGGEMIYNDGRILCDDRRLIIRRYYPWGTRQIPYTSIKGVSVLPLRGASRVRRWRLWGSGDFVHWWNFDPGRKQKSTALVVDVGGHVRPTITPDDASAVERILHEHMSR